MAKRRWLSPEGYKEVMKAVQSRQRHHTCFHCAKTFTIGRQGEEQVIITREPTTGRVIDVSCKYCMTLGLDMLTELAMFPSLLTHRHPLPHRTKEYLDDHTNQRNGLNPNQDTQEG